MQQDRLRLTRLKTELSESVQRYADLQKVTSSLSLGPAVQMALILLVHLKSSIKPFMSNGERLISVLKRFEDDTLYLISSNSGHNRI